MELLKFKNGLYEKYKNNVKHNEKLTYRLACLKMTRNMLLAQKYTVNYYEGIDLYMYGSLWFKVKDNRIIWIKNRCRIPEDWQLDKKEYVRLTRELGIDENVTVMDLYIKEAKGNLRYWKNKVKWKFIKLSEVVRGVF